MKLDKIDKGIPIPPKQKEGNCYQFTKNMEIGDSFGVETQAEAIGAKQFCKRHGIKLTQRKMTWGKPFRLWRIE